MRGLTRCPTTKKILSILALYLFLEPSARATGVSPPAGASTNKAAVAGVPPRIVPVAYLHMPHTADGEIPALLSKTGAFKNMRRLEPAAGLTPYDLIVPFWSDGADKLRWMSLPDQKIKFSPTGEWIFPEGTVFVKTFELPTDAHNPQVKRRLETRLLVCDDKGGVYGVDYKWRPDNSDADLLTSKLVETVAVKSSSNQSHPQPWYYPSRQDCLTCHNSESGGVLGVKTRQLNRPFTDSSGNASSAGGVDNQLRRWNRLGMFEPAFDDEELGTFSALASANDTTRSLEDRARSYLDANCAQCHRPGVTVASFDARYDTLPANQRLIDGAVLIDQGIDRPRIISPHDTWRSIAFMRLNTVGDIRMPPLGRETIDTQGVDLVRRWIMSFPGRPVLDPPTLSPSGGNYIGSVEVALSAAQIGTQIRYTLDGSVPGPSDPQYEKPIVLHGPTVLRTRAYKEGFTRSIVAQELYVISDP